MNGQKQRAAQGRRPRAVVAVILLTVLLSLQESSRHGYAAPAPPLDVEGATYSEYDAETGVWTLRGSPVVVTRAALRLEAGQIVYEEKAGIVKATERVIVRHDRLELRAPRVDARLADEYVDAQDNVVLIERREDGDVTLHATRVEGWLKQQRARAVGSPVELELPQGKLTAPTIEADLSAETADARGGVTFSGRGVRGSSPAARIDRKKGVAVLSGGATVRRGDDVLTAETITIDLRTERMVATGTPRLTIAPRTSP